MKLSFKTKPMSVYSEVEVKGPDGSVLFTSETEPLSPEHLTRLKDSSCSVVATTVSPVFEKGSRAHRIEFLDGRVMELKRRWDHTWSTVDSTVAVSDPAWRCAIHRAWTTRFRLVDEAGADLAVGTQELGALGEAYAVEVLDGARLTEIVACCLVVCRVIALDRPAPAPAAPA